FKSRVHDSTQRSGEPFQGTNRPSKKQLRALATQGTIGSPARRDAVEFSSDFQQGGGGGRPSRSHDSVRHLIALGTPRPGDARALIISGKRNAPNDTRTHAES